MSAPGNEHKRQRGIQRTVEHALRSDWQTQPDLEAFLMSRDAGVTEKQVNRALSALVALKIAERRGFRYHYQYRKSTALPTPPARKTPDTNGLRCMFDAFTREVLIGRGNDTLVLSLDDAVALHERMAAFLPAK